MKKNKILLFTVVFLGFNCAFAQDPNTLTTLFTTKNRAIEGVDGSEFLFKENKNATISILGDKIYKVNYNAYTDDFEVLLDGKILIVKKNKLDVEVNLKEDNSFFIVKHFRNIKGVYDNGFLKLIAINNGYYLFEKQTILLKPEVKPKTGYDEYKPPHLEIQKPNYYIQKPDSSIIKIDFSKKDEIVEVFNISEKNVKEYLKINKIKTKELLSLTSAFLEFSKKTN